MYGHWLLRHDIDVQYERHGNVQSADPDPVSDAHGQHLRQGGGDELIGRNQLREDLLGQLPDWCVGDPHRHSWRELCLHWLERRLHRYWALLREHDERSDSERDLQEEALTSRLTRATRRRGLPLTDA